MVRSTHASPSQLSMAYFPKPSDTSLDIPSFRDGIIDSTLRDIPLDESRAIGDDSDASFQIPVAANSSNLLSDNDFLRGADALATPYAPANPRAHEPLTLSELTPRSAMQARPLPPSPSPGTPTKRQRNDTKFKPSPRKLRLKMPSSPLKHHNLPANELPDAIFGSTSNASSIFSRLRAEVDALTSDAGAVEIAVTSTVVPQEHPQPQPEDSNSVNPSPVRQDVPDHPVPAPIGGATDISVSRGQRLRSRERSMVHDAHVAAELTPAVDHNSETMQTQTSASNLETDVNTTQTAVDPMAPLTLSQLSPVKSTGVLPAASHDSRARRKRSASPMRTSSKRRRDVDTEDAADQGDVRTRKKGKPASATPAAAIGRTRKPVLRENTRGAMSRKVMASSSTATTGSRPGRTVALTRAARNGAKGDICRAHVETAGAGSSGAQAEAATDNPPPTEQMEGSGFAPPPHHVVTLRSAASTTFAARLNDTDVQASTRIDVPDRALATSVGPHGRERSAPEKYTMDNAHPLTADVPCTDQTPTRPDSRSRDLKRSQPTKPPSTAKPTVPVEFHFTFNPRSSARNVELKQSASSSTSGSAPDHGVIVRPVPDFATLQAAHASAVAARKAAAVSVVKPEPFDLRLEARARERDRFEEARRQREEKAEQLAEQRRHELEAQAQQDYKEARRQAVPKANPVPGWYRDAPKRKRA